MAGAVSGMMNFDDLADPEAMKRRDDVNSRMVSSMVGGGEGQSDSRYGTPPPSYYKQPPGNPDTSANELNKQELARVKGLGPKIDVNALPPKQEYQPKFTPAASEPPVPEPQKPEPEKSAEPPEPQKSEKPEKPEKSAAPPAPATPPPPSVPPPVPPKAEEPKKDPEPAVAPIPPRDRFSGQKEDPAVERLSPVATAPIPRVRQATGQEGDAAVAALPPKTEPPKVEEPSGPPSSSLKGDASRVVRSTFPPGSVKYNSKGEPYAASMDKMTPDEKAKVAEAYNSIREKSGASGSSGSDDVLERMRPRRRGAR